MIPVLKPYISDETIRDLVDVLRSGWWGQGAKTYEFERAFANYVGAKYAIGTNSGTSALDLCIKAYGIKGGELITPAMTFVSDAIIGEWNGMDVTFADIDKDSLCIDPEKLVITDETKVIVAVNSHGRLADIDGIREKATSIVQSVVKIRPLIIEDCAHAMYTPGAGQKGDIAIWSFQAVKSMPLWDGGMITTNDEKIAKRLRTLTWLGVEKSTFDRAETKRYTWDYDITQSEGIKAYMTDIQAIVGLGQLRRINEFTAKRRAIQSVYNEAFEDIKEITTPMYSHTVQYYTMKCERRDELSNYLADNGVATSVHFKPLNHMTYWKKAQKRPLPITDEVWPQLLSLPVFYSLKWNEVDKIVSLVQEFYK